MALPMWLRSDRFRRIVALVCFFTVDALVIITLAITTSHPSSALSWTTLTGNNDSLNFGLTNYRACTNDRCLYLPMSSDANSTTAGRASSHRHAITVQRRASVLLAC